MNDLVEAMPGARKAVHEDQWLAFAADDVVESGAVHVGIAVFESFKACVAPAPVSPLRNPIVP
jgi:hypothetical protein